MIWIFTMICYYLIYDKHGPPLTANPLCAVYTTTGVFLNKFEHEQIQLENSWFDIVAKISFEVKREYLF